MTDQDPQPPPEREAEIRRLLAESRATEPMPTDVVERLDGVLVDLGTEGQHVPAPASSLEARRRRRTAVSLVLAAAVVIVAGIGIGRLLQGSGNSDEAASAESRTSVEAEADEQPASPDAVEDGGAADAQSLRAAQAPPSHLPIGRLSRADFATDAQRLRGALTQKRAADGFARLDPASLPTRLVARRSHLVCDPAPWGNGTLVPVVFEGQGAVLAFRPPTGDTQVVDVLQCGSGEALHSTTLPTGDGG